MIEVLEVKWVAVDFDDGATVDARIRFKGREAEVLVELTYGMDEWLFSVSNSTIDLSIPEELLVAGAVLMKASEENEQLKRFIKQLECIYYNYADACIEGVGENGGKSHSI